MTTISGVVPDRSHDTRRTGTLVASWGRRASVRQRPQPFEPGSRDCQTFRPERPDYPERLVPALIQEQLRTADADQWAHVLTHAWLAYNERVIVAEEELAIPALKLLLSGRFPSLSTPETRQALRQTIIDEEFHAYLHMLALDETTRYRGLAPLPNVPRSIILQKCLEARNTCDVEWQRDLVLIVWMIVAEVSINAYLSLLSTDTDIQPMHRLIPALHAKDEASHSAFMMDVATLLYQDLGEAERAFFEQMLAPALGAFAAHDLGAWLAILSASGIGDASRVSAEADLSADGGLLVRDFAGIERIARKLKISATLDAGFTRAVSPREQKATPSGTSNLIGKAVGASHHAQREKSLP